MKKRSFRSTFVSVILVITVAISIVNLAVYGINIKKIRQVEVLKMKTAGERIDDMITISLNNIKGLKQICCTDNYARIDNTNYYTKVEDAVRFVEQTGCDSLAIAVGNAHGPYVKTPNLDLERIYAIRKKVNIPLVLHGCSDIPEEQMKEAVNLGMSKFNIATEYFRTMYQSIEKRINNQEFEGNGVKLMYDIKEEMIDFVIQKIRLLNPNKYSM